MGRLDSKVARDYRRLRQEWGRPRSNGSSPKGAKVVSPTSQQSLLRSWSKRLARRRRRSHYRDREKGGARRLTQIADGLGPNAIFVPGDITVADDLKNVIDTAVEKFGGPRVMSNMRGRWRRRPDRRIVGRTIRSDLSTAI